nr:Conserved hypothetical protein [Haemonchus contortus]
MATITDQQFQQLLMALTEALKGQQMAKSTSQAMEADRSFDILAGRIAEFSYDPDADLTFEAWYQRHQDIFTVDAQMLDEPTRVRLFLHKVDATAYGKYSNYILPKTPRDVTFEEAVSTLMGLFGPHQSLFSRRYACMKLTKDPNDDFVTDAGRVNRECAKFRLAECDENQFKCLIFVSSLQSSDDAFIRLKLLDKIEADPTCSVQSLTEECKRLTNLKQDTKMVEKGTPGVHAVEHSSPKRHPPLQRNKELQSTHIGSGTRSNRSLKPPPAPCWFCGEMHFVRFCAYRRHKCSDCHKVGHKE